MEYNINDDEMGQMLSWVNILSEKLLVTFTDLIYLPLN